MNLADINLNFESFLEKFRNPVSTNSNGITNPNDISIFNLNNIGATNTSDTNTSVFASAVQADETENTEENTDSFTKTSQTESESKNSIDSEEDLINAYDSDKDGSLNETEAAQLFTELLEEEGNTEEFLSGLTGVFGNDNEELINRIITQLYDNETIIDAFDTNADGKLDNSEKAEFAAFAKEILGSNSLSEASNLTSEQLAQEAENLGLANTAASNTGSTGMSGSSGGNGSTGSSGSTGGSSGASGSSGSSGASGSTGTSGSTGASSGSSTSSTSSVDDGLTLEELESQKTEKEGELTDSQEELSKVYSGENEAVKCAKHETEKAKENYDKAVEEDENISDELKQQRSDNLEAITNKETEINDIKTSISEKDTEISNTQTQLSAEESNLEALKSALASCEAASSEDGNNQSEISQKKGQLEEQIQAAEQKVQDAKGKLGILRGEKSTLEGDLSTAEQDLQDLNKTKQDIEGDIAEVCKPETKEAMQAYNDAKTNEQQVIQEQETQAKEVVESTQSELDKINEQINQKKAEETEEENSVSNSTLPEGLMKGVLEGQEGLICEIAEKYDMEPEFLAAIIALESGYGTSSLASSNYNFGGVTGSGDAGYTTRSSDGYKFAKYSSIEAGLDAMAKNLSQYDDRYSDVSAVNIDNVDAIGGHYCVGGDWANKVRTLYNQIKNG